MAYPFGKGNRAPSGRTPGGIYRGGGKNRRRKKPDRKFLFEPLEPRFLLSTDLSCAALADGGPTLPIDDASGVETLNLIDSNDPSSVLASRILAGIDGSSGFGVRIDGNGFNVDLTLDDHFTSGRVAGAGQGTGPG